MPAVETISRAEHRHLYPSGTIKYGLKCRNCHSYQLQHLKGDLVCDVCMNKYEINAYIHDHFAKLSLIAPLNIYKRSEIIRHIGIKLTQYHLKFILDAFFVRKTFGYYAFKFDKHPNDFL